MPSEIPDRWVLLRMRRDADDSSIAWMSYVDDGGARRSLPRAGEGGEDWADTTLSLAEGDGWATFQMRYPGDLVPLVLERAASLPYRSVDYGVDVIVPLPIFIEPPGDAWGLHWEEESQYQLLESVPFERYTLVRMVPGRRRRPPPFRLPLRILTTGSDVWSDGVVADLIGTSWFQHLAVKAHGLVLEHVPPGQVSGAWREPPDMLVVEDVCWDDVRPEVERLSPRGPPRLVLRMDKPSGASSELWRPPPGVAFLTGPDEARFLKELVLAIVHDQALHEAAAAAQREMEKISGRDPAPRPRLVASPESNQSLRMTDAFAAVVEETLGLEGDLLVRDLESSPPPPPAMHEILASAQKKAQPIRDALIEGEQLAQDFRRESFGLIPLAEANERLAAARAARGSVAAAMAAMAHDPESLDELRRRQRRRVDVSLFRTEYSPLLDPRRTMERGAIWVAPDTALRRGAVYRLRVHVGQQTRTSLVVGEVESLESLLPEPESREEGHHLEVAVFGLDFALRSERIQTIYLPPLGPSGFAHFLVRAPRRLGPARLRIVIYHENHVLQSFLLTARVAREEYARSGDPLLRVELEFSRSERFTNLDSLGPRLLSIGTNCAGDNHHVMLKGSGRGADFHIASRVLEDTETEFRSLLDEAAFKAGTARFPTYPADGASHGKDFAAHLRALADFGRKLFNHVFAGSGPKLESLLHDIKKRGDETIQVVRYDDDYAYPWDVFYDFELPDDRNAPVCPGFSVTAGDGQVVPCDHAFDSRVYCGRGFWGVRHRLESMLRHQGEVEKVVKRPGGAPVRVATGLADPCIDRAVAELSRHLKKPEEVVRIAASENVFDVLYEDARRPAIAIIHGHTKDEGDGAAIELLAQPGRLTVGEILRRRSRAEKGWEQPRPLVLLMACDSNAFDTRTLTDFIRSFLKSGALGVVGTNCRLTSALGSRFASDVTRGLLDADPPGLGAVVVAFRRRLLTEENPLGFVFTFYGDADLTVES